MNEFSTTTATADKATNAEHGTVLFDVLRASGVLQGRLAETLGEIGLSYPKYDALRYLRHAREPLSLSRLAQCQHCARSNITQLVDRLEAEGLVRRVDDPADRRSVLAELTAEGSRLADEGAERVEALRARFAELFSAAERTQLGALLDRIQW